MSFPWWNPFWLVTQGRQQRTAQHTHTYIYIYIIYIHIIFLPPPSPVREAAQAPGERDGPPDFDQPRGKILTPVPPPKKKNNKQVVPLVSPFETNPNMAPENYTRPYQACKVLVNTPIVLSRCNSALWRAGEPNCHAVPGKWGGWVL